MQLGLKPAIVCIFKLNKKQLLCPQGYITWQAQSPNKMNILATLLVISAIKLMVIIDQRNKLLLAHLY